MRHHLPINVPQSGVYFAHVAATPEADAVGIVVMRAGNDRLPCRGLDSDPLDDFSGHVLLSANGVPMDGVTVHYFQDSGPIGQVKTDVAGRHSIPLPPGTYGYRFDLPMEPPVLHEVEVRPGRVIQWETSDGDSVTTHSKEVACVSEVWVGDWHSDDEPFQWLDVEDMIVATCRMVPLMSIVSFNRFQRNDLLQKLQQRGVAVADLPWRDLHWATAYRNFVALIQSGLLTITIHERADFQMTRCVRYTGERRVQYVPGLPHYLADARAAAALHAAQGAASGSGVPSLMPIAQPMNDVPSPDPLVEAIRLGMVPDYLRKQC